MVDDTNINASSRPKTKEWPKLQPCEASDSRTNLWNKYGETV